MKKLFALLNLLLIFQVALAHKGGHGNETNSHQRTWHFENHSIATKGSFLLVKEDSVFIENGQAVVSFKIEELSWVDRDFIERKSKQIEALNTTTNNETSKGSISFFLLGGISLLTGVLVFLLLRASRKKQPRTLVTAMASVCILITVVACGSDDGVTDLVEELISATSDAATIEAAFAPYSNVTTISDETYFYVESDGIPDHEMMVGITAWIAQVPIPQPYAGDNAWSIPLTTKYAENPVSIEENFQRGAIAIAANGIPIFNPINASGLVSNDIGELDPFGGHSGRGDDYHYHTAPIHLESTSGLKPIAYALDGYAVFGSLEPDGSTMANLDEYHGHEYTDGSYHYHGTDTYPYMIAAMRGEVTLEGDAPQNQVNPQPQADPPRGGDPHGINSDNLLITDLVEKSAGNGYVLTYTSSDVEGSVDYSWDENGFFTFIFNDVDGTTTTETFQR